MASCSPPHYVIFPFMSQGHTVPLLYLARLLRQRSISVTIFTTPGNSTVIRASLHDTDVCITELLFPQNIDGIPQGVESTDKLPSMSCFPHFMYATKLMQPQFEKELESLQSVSCIISDGFLGWTRQSAAKFGIPRLVFFGMSSFTTTLYVILLRDRPHARTTSLNEAFPISSFPWLKLTRNDFEPPFNEVEPKGSDFEFMMENMIEMSKSHGLILNTFYELESSYTDYWNQKIGPKAWCIGPLCLAKKSLPPALETLEKPILTQWLDEKLAKEESVLYVAFGTQAELPAEQLGEIAVGLEQSNVSFLWVLRPKNVKTLEGFEERVKGRGLILKEWVDQMEILQHESVKGFLSHCGWNSVTESLCAGVPILALPFMAEQHLNARFVAEEIGIGLRIMPTNGSFRGFVTAEEVQKMVKELMEGKKGKKVRQKVKVVGKAARIAMGEGGSSSCTLDLLIDDMRGKQTTQFASD